MDLATIRDKVKGLNERDRLEVTRSLAPSEEIIRNLVYFKGIERVPDLPGLIELVVYTRLNVVSEDLPKTDRYDIGTVREIATF